MIFNKLNFIKNRIIQKTINFLTEDIILYFLQNMQPQTKRLSNTTILLIYKVIKQKWCGNTSPNLEIYDSLSKWMLFAYRDHNLYTEQRKENIKKQDKLKIGCVGQFSGLLSFPRELLEFYATKADLYIYDVHFKNATVDAYAEFAIYKKLKNYPLDNAFIHNHSDLLQYASLINNDQLDVVIFFSYIPGILQFIDLINTPNILAINTSSYHIPHDKCKVQSFVQQGYPYQVKNKKIYNLKKQKNLKDYTVYDKAFFYDKRGIASGDFRKNYDVMKNPKITYTGGLYKLYSKPFLECLVELLKNNPKLNFVYYGKGEDTQEQLTAYFRHNEVIEQVEYKGSYNVMRDQTGKLLNLLDWEKVKKDIQESCLFMQSFPISGASALVEQYLLGVPTVSLLPDNTSWLNKKEYCSFKLPFLYTKSNTANSLNEYIALCQQILDNRKFAEQIIEEQYLLVEQILCNKQHFWEQVEDMIACSNQLTNKNYVA